MSDYTELKRLAEDNSTPSPFAHDENEQERIARSLEILALIAENKRLASAYVAAGEREHALREEITRLKSDNESLRGSCKALGSRNLRALERENRVLERKNTKHVINKSEFISSLERKNEEIDKLKAENEALRNSLRPLLAHWDDLKAGESLNVDAARAAMGQGDQS